MPAARLVARPASAGSCTALSSMRAIRGRPLTAAQPLLGGRSCLSRSSTVVRAAEEAGIKDRAVAAAPYLVPLFDSLRYGAAQFRLALSLSFCSNLRRGGLLELCSFCECMLRRRLASRCSVFDACALSIATCSSCAGKFALAQNPFLYKLLAPLDPLIRLYTTVQ